MASKIEDYAMIGDLGTAALVGRDGSIDWLCWPRFDSDACFAALLGTAENGRWRIAPEDAAARVERRYRPHTLILESVVTTKAGRFRMVEFMAMQAGHSTLVRVLSGESGVVPIEMELARRYGYGECEPWLSALADGAIAAV